MQRIILLTIACFGLLTNCSKAQLATADKKILIVYLSRTNNTRAVAEIIHKHIGGDLVPIELVTPYPDDYKTTVRQVAKENATGYLPPLKTRIDSIGKYDIVFIGFPTWGMQLPPPLKTFLKKNNFKGKTVIPFNTNAGYGIGSSFSMVKELCTGCIIPEGFSTKGGIERDGELLVIKNEKAKTAEEDIIKWLKKIGVTQ